MKVIVAITGASGGIYARLCIEQLIQAAEVEQIALIVSDTAREVLRFEGVTLPESEKIVRHANDDMFAAVASGSAGYDAMVVVPASMGSVGRIAAGVSLSLIERAADVMLKERRRLIVVVRETPYSLIHLRNMTTLTEAGAVILPASPSFYSHPTTLDQVAMTVVERIVTHIGIKAPHYEWRGEN
jgi:4-hydroxy-3-polyprenylbenzoate decarboxylase